MTESINLIQRNTIREDYDGRDWWDETVEPEYGFFTDKAEAERFAEEKSRPGREHYEEAYRKYAEARDAEQAKAVQARALGFNHNVRLFSRPERPDYFDVVEVNRA